MTKDRDDGPTKPPSSEADETPRILKGVILAPPEFEGRRRLLRNSLAVATLGALSGALTRCDAEYDITIDDKGECKCHVVCACDTDEGGEGSQHEAKYSGTTCTCNTVCTCDTVCTCEGESGSSGGGGGGYWYPN